MKGILFFMLILTVVFGKISAQNTVNQFDSNGKRHGVWKKYFDKTDQLRYEGRFDHGKEVDTFKFYRLNKKKSVLSAVKVFNPNNDNAYITFLSSKGKVISKGAMKGKLYIGEWIYYHNKSEAIMTKEFYNDKGLLNGERTVFYENGQLAETTNYVDDKLEGVSKSYSQNGNILTDFTYKDNELHGFCKYYGPNSQLLSEGEYKEGFKYGIWKYYENGKLKTKKDHTKRPKVKKKQ